MAYAAPPNFAAGAILTEAQLDTLSDDIAFLANPPKCRVYNNAAISVADATSVALTFNSERFDTDTMHSTGVNTSRITFTTAGTYLVGGHAVFEDNSTGTRMLNIRLGGATILAYEARNATTSGGTGAGTGLSVQTLYAFSAGNYVELVAYQNSGGARNVNASGNYSPEFSAIWQSL